MAELGRPRLALSTGSLYTMALERVFALAAAAGYDGMELLVDARMDSYDVPYLQGLSRQWQVPVLSVHTPFARDVEGWPRAMEGRVGRALELAEALGAQTVIAHTPPCWQALQIQTTWGCRGLCLSLPWSSRADRRYARWLDKELPLLQARSAVRIAVENMPARRLLGRRVAGWHFSREAELRRWPYLVLDTTHWGTWGKEPVYVYESLKGQISHVHLSNYDGREHRLPFHGRLRLEELLSSLRANAFGGIVAVELDPWAVAEGDWSERNLRERLAAVSVRCRELLGLPSSHSHSASKY